MSENNLHPLLQPVVIRALKPYLLRNIKMWQTCRLVCKTWHDEFLDKWRKRFQVYIGDEGQENSMDVASFWRAFEMEFLQMEMKPFRKISTRKLPKNCVYNDTVATSPDFWETCGSWLKVINLHHVQFNDCNLLANILLQLTPNLQHLEIGHCLFQRDDDAQDEEDGQMVLPQYDSSTVTQPNLKTLRIWLQREDEILGIFPIKMMTLLSTFTQIEELRLDGFSHLPWTLNHVINAIETIRREHQNSVLNIKNLYLSQIDNLFTPDLAKRFSELGLPLVELGLPINGMGAVGLPQIMVKHSNLHKVGLGIKKGCPNYELDQTGVMDTKFPLTMTKLSLCGVHTDQCDNWNIFGEEPTPTQIIIASQTMLLKPIYIMDQNDPTLTEQGRDLTCEVSFFPL